MSELRKKEFCHFYQNSLPAKMQKALAPTRVRKQTNHSSFTSGWTKEEDELLMQLKTEHPGFSWDFFVPFFHDKRVHQIAGRWEKVLDPNLVKGSWTLAEDQIIIDFVKRNGDKEWSKLSQLLPGRIGKQCRERWRNHLDPNLVKNEWTLDEDKQLIELHEKYGNSWTKIATFFKGRTDNAVKNRWNSTIKKRLERIERGEPIIQKRGRKPKSIPTPDFFSLDEKNINVSPSTSPMHGSKELISLVPIEEQMSISRTTLKSPTKVASVEENRSNLIGLLESLSK